MICDPTDLVSLSQDLQNALLSPSFADVKIRVDSVTFWAHKVLLASRSPVFKAMFETDMRENQENVVDIVDMDPITVEAMLQHIYTGRTEELSMGRAIELYTAADRYNISGLKERCKGFIVKEIDANNICSVAVLANLHGDEDLTKAIKRALKKDLRRVLTSQKWRDLVTENPLFCSVLLESIILEEHEESDTRRNQATVVFRPTLPTHRMANRRPPKIVVDIFREPRIDQV